MVSSGKELAGPRKIANKSIDRSLGSLRKNRKLASQNRSFVMKQVSSLRKQNGKIIEEIVKLRKYTTNIEKINLHLQGQQGSLYAKIIKLQEKIKRISAENMSLKQLLQIYRQKYDLEDEAIDACLNLKTVGPERILPNSNGPDADFSGENSDGELPDSNDKLKSPMMLQCGEVGPDETLPSYVYIPVHEDEVDRSECPNALGSLSPLSVRSKSPSNDGSLADLTSILRRSIDEAISSAYLRNHNKLQKKNTESQQDCPNVNSDDDYNDLSLRLPESDESSLFTSTELEALSESILAEPASSTNDENQALEHRISIISPTSDLPDQPEHIVGISASKRRSSKTANSKDQQKEKASLQDRFGNEPLSESPENAPADSVVSVATESAIDKCDNINSQKLRLKSRNSNVKKTRGRPRKMAPPRDKDNSTFDFLSTSKDSFIIDDGNQVKLPRLQSLPAEHVSNRQKYSNDENEAPSRRPSRKRAVVSYIEPKLGSKLRRGDKHTDGSMYTSLSPRRTVQKKARKYTR